MTEIAKAVEVSLCDQIELIDERASQIMTLVGIVSDAAFCIMENSPETSTKVNDKAEHILLIMGIVDHLGKEMRDAIQDHFSAVHREVGILGIPMAA